MKAPAFAATCAAVLLTTSSLMAQAQAPADEGVSPHPRAAIVEAAPEPTPFSFARPFGWTPINTRLDVSGYLLPQFELVSLPSALPRDRTQYGARGTRVGFAFYGMPFPDWSYIAHVVVTPAGTESLTLLSPTPEPSIGITLPTATQTSISVEEATVGYRPVKWFMTKAGLLRIPFSIGQSTPIPKQMFPFRPQITSEFQSGADAGALGTFALFDARLQANLGAFIGTSLGNPNPTQTVRGTAFAASVAAHPLGAMSLREGDPKRGPFAFALGVGSIYRRASSFDPTGYEASEFNDARFTAWLRASFRGAYLQGEYLRRLRTDDLSGRPSMSEGGYGEASYHLPISSVAVAPMVRAGVLSTSIDFAPRKFTSFEGALAFYPQGKVDEPERLRLLVEYLRAETTPFAEVQHEGLLQLQLEF